MRNRTLKYSIFIAILLLGISSETLQANAAAFTRISMHPQAVGLGGSIVGRAQGAMALKWNPAGIGEKDLNEVLLTGTKQYETTSLRLDSLWQTRFGSVALGYMRSDFGSTPNTDFDSVTSRLSVLDGSIDYLGQSVYMGYSKPLSKTLSVGATAGVVHEVIESESATGWGMDLGLLYKVNSWRWGATISNLIEPEMNWSTASEATATVPRFIQTGITKLWLGGRVSSSIEGRYRDNRDPSTHIGIEFFPISSVSCRIGSDDGQLTMGTGLHLDSLEAHLSWRKRDFSAMDEAFQFGLKYEWERRK